MDKSQLAMVAAKLEETEAPKARDYYDAEAKKRQVAHGGTAPGKPRENTQGNVALSVQARDQAGAAVGVSGRTVDKAMIAAKARQCTA